MTFTGPGANQSWAEDEGFEFEIWSDDDKDLALYYGAARSVWTLAPDRVTKVFDASGTLVLEYIDRIDVGTHPAQVLEDVTLLFGS